MSDIKIVASGVCKKCDHPQSTHEDNAGCSECDCDSIGSY